MASWLPVVALALVPLAVAALVAGFRAPLTALLPLYAIAVPIGSTFSVPGLPPAFGSASSVLGMVLTAALLVRLLTVPESRHVPELPLAAWLALLALAIATLGWTVSVSATRGGLPVLGSLVLLYAVVVTSHLDAGTLARLEVALVAGGVAVSIWGIYQAATDSLPESDASGPRFGRDLLGPNHTAAALLLPLAVSLGRAVAARTAAVRIAFAASATVLIAAITLTGSRGGLVSAAATFVAFALQSRWRRVLFGYGVLVTAVVVGVIWVNPGGIGERMTREGSSGRTDIWRVGLASCRTDCLTGTGWGTFPDVYERTQPVVADAKVLRRGTTFEPHNIFLLVAVEAGITGLLLLVGGLLLTLRQAWRIPRRFRGPPLAALAGLVASGFFLSNFEFKYFWMTLLYVALVHRVRATPAVGVPPTPDRPAVAALPHGGAMG